MSTSVFDPLTAMRALVAAGVDRNQAEAHAEQLRNAAAADLDQLATKKDLAELATKLSSFRSEVRYILTILMALAAAGVGRLFDII